MITLVVMDRDSLRVDFHTILPEEVICVQRHWPRTMCINYNTDFDQHWQAIHIYNTNKVFGETTLSENPNALLVSIPAWRMQWKTNIQTNKQANKSSGNLGINTVLDECKPSQPTWTNSVKHHLETMSLCISNLRFHSIHCEAASPCLF